MVTYDPNQSVRDARQTYFDRNGFGDSGYTDRFLKFKFLGIPLRFPNTPTRLRAVWLHDLHHIATEYETNWQGEGEVTAWEIGSGGFGKYWSVWLYTSTALLFGFLVAPKAVWKAYRRGRRCENLFQAEQSEALLNLTVSQLRERVRLASH